MYIKGIGIFAIMCIVFFAQGQDYASIDKLAEEAPEKTKHCIGDLTEYLRENATNDLDKTRIIFSWIAIHIDIDLKKHTKEKQFFMDAELVIKKKKTTSLGYAELFKALCDSMTIPCEIIQGYVKADNYRPGEIFTHTNHAWNAVKLNGQWHLVDVCWGSGKIENTHNLFRKITGTIGFNALKTKKKYIKQLDSRYFLADNITILNHHLPAIPMWQLQDCAIPLLAFESKEYNVKESLNKLPESSCFNAADSIRKTISKENINREMCEARTSIQFNPRNKKSLAEAYLIQANEWKSQALLTNNKLTTIDSAIANFNRAKLHYALFKGSLAEKHKLNKNWNKAYNKKLIKQNEKYVKGNNKLIRRNDKFIKRNKSENKKLQIEISKIKQENKKLAIEQIEQVKHNRKSPTTEQETSIETNMKTIKTNKEKIGWNKKEKSDLRRNNKEEKELFINKNIEVILNNHKRNWKLITKNILLKVENSFILDTLIMTNKDSIRQYKQHEDKLRQMNENEGRAYIEQNIQLIKENFRENKLLIKENKRAIKKNKRLSKEDQAENTMYLKENIDFIEDNNSFIQGNLDIIVQNRNDNKLLKRESKALKAETKLLKQENRLEQKRFKRQTNWEEKRYASAKKANKEKIDACKLAVKQVKDIKK